MSNAIAVLDAVRERVDESMMGARVRSHLVLRRRRRAVRRGAREAARDGDPVGGDRPRALRRDRRARAALPLRHPGQLARADRVPAREQRPADRARGARRHAWPQRPRARDPAAGMERGARTSSIVGSAVVAAHPAGTGLRDRPARVPRHLRGLARHGGARRRDADRRSGRDGDGRAQRWRGRRGRLHEGGGRRVPQRAAGSGSSPASRRSSASTASPRPRTRR